MPDPRAGWPTELVVCPLCVQWRCVICKEPDCYDHDGVQEFEPYWPDGSVAVLTQDDYCESCQEALDEYERTKDGF